MRLRSRYLSSIHPPSKHRQKPSCRRRRCSHRTRSRCPNSFWLHQSPYQTRHRLRSGQSHQLPRYCQHPAPPPQTSWILQLRSTECRHSNSAPRHRLRHPANQAQRHWPPQCPQPLNPGPPHSSRPKYQPIRWSCRCKCWRLSESRCPNSFWLHQSPYQTRHRLRSGQSHQLPRYCQHPAPPPQTSWILQLRSTECRHSNSAPRHRLRHPANQAQRHWPPQCPQPLNPDPPHSLRPKYQPTRWSCRCKYWCRIASVCLPHSYSKCPSHTAR